MKPFFRLYLSLAIVAAAIVAQASATIYVADTTNSVLLVRIDSYNGSLSRLAGTHLGSSAAGGSSWRVEPCPDVATGYNTGLLMSVKVDGQECAGYQTEARTKLGSSFCPDINLHAISSTQIYVSARERRPPSSLSPGNSSKSIGAGHCPRVIISQSSRLDITIKLSASYEYRPFRGLNLSDKSGVRINVIVNIGDCPVPGIDMSQVSGSRITIHDL